MTFEPIDRSVEELAERASNCRPLSDELNSMPYTERLEYARQVKTIVNSDPLSLCRIEIATAYDEWGDEHLLDMKAKLGRNLVDIYDLPGRISSMNISTDAKLRLDRFHSENMQQGHKDGVGIFTLPPQYRFMPPGR